MSEELLNFYLKINENKEEWKEEQAKIMCAKYLSFIPENIIEILKKGYKIDKNQFEVTIWIAKGEQDENKKNVIYFNIINKFLTYALRKKYGYGFKVKVGSFYIEIIFDLFKYQLFKTYSHWVKKLYQNKEKNQLTEFI